MGKYYARLVKKDSKLFLKAVNAGGLQSVGANGVQSSAGGECRLGPRLTAVVEASISTISFGCIICRSPLGGCMCVERTGGLMRGNGEALRAVIRGRGKCTCSPLP